MISRSLLDEGSSMFKRRRVLVTLAALVAVALAGVQSVASARERSESGSTVTQAVGSTADGAALLRGVFFAQGDIGSELSSLPYFYMSDEDLERNRSAGAVAVVDDILAAIEEIKPGFLGTFSVELRSGDPFRVENAIRDAGSALSQVVELRPAIKSEAAGVIVHTEIAVVNVGVGAVAAAIAVTVAAVIVLIAVIRYVAKTEAERLASERAIAQLTQVLRRI
jgi:SdpC family antimicrobial peptide